MMKLITFALLIAGISSLPQTPQDVEFRQERFVTDLIAGAIEDLQWTIRDAGLDPLVIPFDTGYVALPVPEILNAQSLLEDFFFSGLSNIVIDHLNFSLFALRVDITLSLPHIQVTCKNAQARIGLFDTELTASASGSLSIVNVRVPAALNIFLNLAGFRVTNADLEATVGQIQSDLNIVLLGTDLSDSVNTFLGQTIPRTLNNFHDEINQLLEHYAPDLINSLM